MARNGSENSGKAQFLSVIIAAYNESKNIGAQLEALKGQDYSGDSGANMSRGF